MSTADGTRGQRRRKLGVDSVGRVVWREWEPGNEYVRSIRIRNVDVRMQTIQYKLPLRRAIFFTGFPEPVALGSGMSFDLEVRFRPIEFAEMYDVIEIMVVGRGSYVVHLECPLPCPKLQLPPQHDFAYVASSTTATHSVMMKNTGSASLSFEWEVPPPFAIAPISGALGPGKGVELCLSFAPTEACALVSQALCKMVENGKVLASMKLSGIGKYPFIRVSGGVTSADRVNNTAQLDFGRVLTGTTHCMEFCVENPSMVDVAFALEDVVVDNKLPSPFTITPRSGIIARGAVQNFKTSFTPTTSGMVSVSEMRLTTVAGNSIAVRLSGVSAAPEVHLSTRTIDFGDVRLDDEVMVPEDRQSNSLRRFFNIKNTSNVATCFHTISASPGAAFVVTPTAGELPAKSTVRVQVEFCPTHPINYLRRLLILVRHMEGFLYVDVFGSAYDSIVRPLPFGIDEVEAFYLRHDFGLAEAEPRDLAIIADGLRSGRLYDDVLRQTSLSADAGLGLEKLMGYYTDNRRKSRSKGLVGFSSLSSSFSTTAPFYLSEDVLLFPTSECEKHITVHNRSNNSATAYWCVPSGSVFFVKPMQGDVPPCSSRSFTVSMSWNTSASTACQFLECYVNYSEMRSFRLVEEGAFTPPHFFTLRCQRSLGSTFCGGAGTMTSIVKAPKFVVFPACRSGDFSHAVLYVENHSDVAVMFTVDVRMKSFDLHDVVYDELSDLGLLSCNPPSGLIPPHQRLPLVLSFCPQRRGVFHGEATVMLSNNPKDGIRVALIGESFTPQLVIENGSMVILRPTCVAGETRHRLTISNPTCIPVKFDVFPSQELRGVVRCDPFSGLLDARQRAELTLIFIPTEAVVYEGHLNFIISDGDTLEKGPATCSRTLPLIPEQGDLEALEKNRRCIISCPCMGEGRYAVVEVEPVTIEHEGPAMQKKTFEWTIYNSGLCDVYYEVRWMSISDPTQGKGDAIPVVQLSHNKSGKLAARSHTVVLVTLQPQAGLSEYILYTLVGGSGMPLNIIPDSTSLEEVRQHAHCEVRLKGTRPAVQITDVRSLQQYKSQLWCQLSINSVNEVLAAPVQPIDVEKDSFAFPKYIEGLDPIFMNVGVGCIHHVNKEVLLRVENSGQCPASFRFWYPTEHEGGNETWFIENEELEDVQQVLSDRLLEISPREGTIPVGSHKVITMVYRHQTIGTHCLPVLLRLSEGKKVLLVLEGRTVSSDSNTLAFHHPYTYNLHPVALGDMEPPLHTTIVENTASHEVEYVVQEDLTQLVAEKNCGFPVFQCLNPRGVIPAGGTVHLNWYFRPLEARSYSIEVLLHTVNGEEYSMQFLGVGYHPKKMLPDAMCALINEAFLSIPVSPTLRLPADSCPVSLSMDVMRIGVAPCFSLHRRICYIKNTHAHHTYTFFWSTELTLGSSKMEVTPPSGKVEPGKQVCCCLTLHCGSLSQILETPVFCHILNESLSGSTGQRRRFAEQAATKRRSSRVAEVEEEEGPFDDPLLDSKPTPERPFERSTCTKPWLLGASKKRTAVTAIQPEFQSVRGLEAFVSRAAAISDGSQLLYKVEESVANHALEVLVQARVMPIGEYEQLFGIQALQQTYFPTFFQNDIDPFSIPVSRGQRANGEAAHSAEEAAEALQVLDRLLRTIIARPLVQRAFTEPVNERVPYYRDMVPASAAKVAFMEQCLGETERQTSEYDAQLLPSLHSSVDVALSARAESHPQGAVLNIVEELLADVTMQAVGAVLSEPRVASMANHR